MTYNQEKFITHAIEGFLLQKTNFPIEIIIHDDCSTDKTREIIQTYTNKHPNLIKPIFQSENQFSKGIKIQPSVLPKCKGKYIALCEGDDYWNDPYKLQKQVDFLEQDPGYVLCWTRFNTLDDATGNLRPDNNGDYFSNENGIDFDFDIFAKGWHIGMQTLVYKRNALINNNHFNNEHYRDVFLISDLLTVGKGHCLNDITAVYRVHSAGIYSSTDELARAKIGAVMYREIYKTYSDNPFLKSKYKKFTTSYIKCLIKKEKYSEALLTLVELEKLTTAPLKCKNELYNHIEEDLFTPIANQLKQRDERFRQKEAELNHIYQSLSYKIGRTITLPARWISNLPKLSSSLISKLESTNKRNKRELESKGIIFIDKNKISNDIDHLKPLPTLSKNTTQRLIVSLTSFPERIPEIFFTLYSLINQTTQPDMLILWLAEEQFPHKEDDLPERVLNLKNKGLTIKWCKDLKSYKKLIFALKEYPNDIIVTADDDIFYPETWLERLHKSYLHTPHNIHCHRAHRITFNASGDMDSYNVWPKCITTSDSTYLNFCTTGGGVLYPAGSLYKDALNEELFMKLCPTADDIWFWAMAVLNNTKIQVVDSNITDLIYVDPELEFQMKDGITLYQTNIINNDKQLKEMSNYYNEIIDHLITENSQPLHYQ